MEFKINPGKIRRIKFWDKLFGKLISFGGILIILSVLGILVMILKVALPLFYEPQLQLTDEISLPADRQVIFLSSDDYSENFFVLDRKLQGTFHKPSVDKKVRKVSLPEFSSSNKFLAFDSYGDNVFSILTAKSEIFIYKINYNVRFDGEQRKIEPDIVLLKYLQTKDISKKSFISFQARYDDENQRAIIAVQSGENLKIIAEQESSSLLSDSDENERFVYTLPHQFKGLIAKFRLSQKGDKIWLGSSQGALEFWKFSSPDFPPELILSDRTINGKITSLHYLFGDESLAVGDNNAELRMIGYHQDSNSKTGFSSSMMHEFRLKNDLIRKSLPLLRNKTLVSLTEQGKIHFYYSTADRKLFRLAGDKPYQDFALNDRGNYLTTLDTDNKLQVFRLDMPHPEFSLSMLFNKIFYEGYPKSTWTWQSSSGNDDFESKYSFIPLIFGSLKGTFFAMIFAVPVSIIAALYTSQFSGRIWKKWIKPTVEIMAAFPSVVIGFLAALWLAPLLETHLTTLLVALLSAPIFFFLAYYLCRTTKLVHHRWYQGGEFLINIFLIGFWLFLSSLVSPEVEQIFFEGSLTQWMYKSFGTVYDQRNSIVISFALGFAVIPIIFTISEDAISNVPQQLTAGSLALGATRWQTACRLIIPTASPGIFVATIIGFGRAVGETMIILMATGNTPVVDWSVFNGMRTLAANIAVEIPEAPVNGTLYRILFLSASLLFILTFILNAVAELVRLKLRERYGKL